MADTYRPVPGSFCWMELATTDQGAAKAFYSSLFGWTAHDAPIGAEQFYTMLKLDGREAAACYTMMADERSMGIPPHWNLYIAVENADASAARAAELGGQVLAPPFDVMDAGRMAVIRDPGGAIFHIWQANRHGGIRAASVPGAFCWADLNTGDAAAAGAFYSALFGWTIAPGENDPSGYLHISNGKTMIGGIPSAGQRDPNAPPHWMLYFQVADCDASAAKAGELGGRALMPPLTLEGVGRFAVIADPQGAAFSLFTPAPRG